MFVVSSEVRRSRPVFRGAALIVAAVLAASSDAAGRQRSKTPTYEEPAGLRKERLARELEERRERQLRAGLADEAAESAKQLAEMIRAQNDQCRRWWEIQDLTERGGRLTKEQTKLVTNVKAVTQLAADCYWRPGASSSSPADGDDPLERQPDEDLTGMQLVNELSGRYTRALLFVQPVLATTVDPDLVNPMSGYMSVATTAPEFTRMMKALGRLGTGEADLAEADRLLQQMRSLVQKLVPPSPGATLFVIGMRRGSSELRGDIPAALNHAREEVAFVEAQFGGNSIQLCPTLWQQASLLMTSGQPERALESANRCLVLASARSSSLTYASALNNLGVIHHRSGATDRALEAYQKSLAVYERNAVALQDRYTAAQDPLLQVHANLGLANWRAGAVPQAYRHLQLARERMLTEGNNYFTERGVIAGMAQLSAELDVFLTVERAVPQSPDRTTLALPMLLERKGFALGTKATTLKALANEPEQLREYRRLLAYRAMLARATPSAPDEREKQRQIASEVDFQIQTLEANAKLRASTSGATDATTDPRITDYAKAMLKAYAKLSEKRDKNPPKDDRRSEMEVKMDLQRQAEAEIAPRFKDYLESQQRALRGNRETLVPSIQAVLPDTAALVEMVRFRPFNAAASAGERWAPPRYGAYVVRRSGAPAFVDWGDAAPIDELIVEFRRTLSQPRGTLAHDLGRRLDAALLQPTRAALGTATQIYLSPDGALNLVPFGALVDENDRYLVETLTFNYVSSGRDLLRAPAAATTARGVPVVVADPAFDTGGTASGASPTRSVLGNHFEPLPGTAAEAQAIKSLLANARVFTGDQATETALKEVAAPRVLHVATHGFFLEDQDLSGAAAAGSAPAAEDPMLRSGLVFAGANSGRSGSDDGVLTALEAAALDLAGTELVVLSACETGVGDVRTGEGVFGLRRAFMVAGAETLVMSLWQVDDDATRRLMEEFYGRLAKGEGRAEALRQASLALLRDPARRHPFYWASFISTGEAGRMRR